MSPELRRFEIHGHFHAEDIDDAFARLAEHFRLLSAEEFETASPLHDAPLELAVEPRDEPAPSRLT